MINKILDFLFPPICGVCGKTNRNWICDDCKNSINPRLRQIKDINIALANERNNKVKNKRKIFYIFDYESQIRDLLIDYKFNDKSYLYKTFSNVLLSEKSICRLLNYYDIIIPVPMSNKSKKIRGYNQTELIAKELAKNQKITIKNESNILIKEKENKMQSTLSYYERKENVKDVFKVNENKFEAEKLTGKNILVFDDIYTTGFTLNECINEIEKYTLGKVDGLVLAKGKLERS